MSRKRSSYRPKGANPKSWLIACQGASLLSMDDQARRLLAFRLAVQDVGAGVVATQGWKTILGALNTLGAFSRDPRVMRGADEFIKHAESVAISIIERRRAGGSRALHAKELQVLHEVESLWAEVLSVVTHAEFFRAEQAVARYTEQARGAGGERLITLEGA